MTVQATHLSQEGARPRMGWPRCAPFAVLALLAFGWGCASQTGDASQGELGTADVAVAEIELSPPDLGLQLETEGAVIEAGDDVRWCEVLTLPGDDNDLYPVDRIELAMAAQGRELALTVAEPGSETAAIMEPGTRVPCLRAGEVFGEGLRLVTSTLHNYHDQRYPDGVGRVFHGGDRLAVEYHYLNDTPEPVLAKAKINLHVTDARNLARVAQTAAFDNLTIYTPPAGRSTHLGECTVTAPVTTFELTRRTRQWGTDFKVWVVGGERDGELLWHSGDYRDTQFELAQPLNLQPGEGFRFQCGYENLSDEDLAAGSSAGDELCMLQVGFWATGSDVATDPQRCVLLDVDTDGIARPHR